MRYQDLVDEQRAGRIHGVFVDDTGSPGLRDTPSHLHRERKSWVAVVVPKSVIAEVWQQFPRAIVELQALTGATEFHFTDHYMRRRAFENVPLSKRLARCFRIHGTHLRRVQLSRIDGRKFGVEFISFFNQLGNNG